MGKYFSATLILLAIFITNAVAKAQTADVIEKAFQLQMPNQYEDLQVTPLGTMNTSKIQLLSNLAGKNLDVTLYRIRYKQNAETQNCVGIAHKVDGQAGPGLSIYSVEVFFCGQDGMQSLARPDLIKVDVIST